MKNESGFTLVELLITIVVASILLAFAVPAFNSFVQNNRIASQANELISAMAIARSEAIKRKVSITVCNSSDSATCSGGWNQGWLAFIDTDNDGTVDTGETILRVWGGFSGGSTITTVPAGVSTVLFDRLGGANNTVVFQLRIPNCRGDKARNITLRTTGSIETTTAAC